MKLNFPDKICLYAVLNLTISGAPCPGRVADIGNASCLLGSGIQKKLHSNVDTRTSVSVLTGIIPLTLYYRIWIHIRALLILPHMNSYPGHHWYYRIWIHIQGTTDITAYEFLSVTPLILPHMNFKSWAPLTLPKDNNIQKSIFASFSTHIKIEKDGKLNFRAKSTTKRTLCSSLTFFRWFTLLDPCFMGSGSYFDCRF